MASDVEIIEFQIPTCNRKNLFVTNIPVSQSEAEIYHQLDNCFSKYGLLHEIQIFRHGGPASHEQPSNAMYAFVKFYSSMAARKAKEQLNDQLTIAGNLCKIAFAKRRNLQTLSRPLHLSKCVELANFYLGFNGWSSKVTKLEEDKDVLPVDGVSKVRYFCVVSLCVAHHNLSCDGLGAWEETYNKADPMSRVGVTAKSKKLSQQRALENAFSKLLIIVLGNGKVSVEVNTTLTEQILRTNHVDDSELLKVNEVDHKLAPDSENEDFDQSDLDGANLQILQELEDT
ncbi:RAD52 motif-containing protein 1-like [Gigantopelta aegis]|uniref:RAD52 motif-containing protein 1-like n=1 Tax=Gigantopelta aegis TaxID=1735272 RepID=UPI001B88B2A8|nr:RAD52 motif-containing protein 1-like [Gigantopelta aegis]